MIITLWSCFALNLAIIIKNTTNIINQIADYLGIYCFSLKKKERKFE